MKMDNALEGTSRADEPFLKEFWSREEEGLANFLVSWHPLQMKKRKVPDETPFSLPPPSKRPKQNDLSSHEAPKNLVIPPDSMEKFRKSIRGELDRLRGEGLGTGEAAASIVENLDPKHKKRQPRIKEIEQVIATTGFDRENAVRTLALRDALFHLQIRDGLGPMAAVEELSTRIVDPSRREAAQAMANAAAPKPKKKRRSRTVNPKPAPPTISNKKPKTTDDGSAQPHSFEEPSTVEPRRGTRAYLANIFRGGLAALMMGAPPPPELTSALLTRLSARPVGSDEVDSNIDADLAPQRGLAPPVIFPSSEEGEYAEFEEGGLGDEGNNWAPNVPEEDGGELDEVDGHGDDDDDDEIDDYDDDDDDDDDAHVSAISESEHHPPRRRRGPDASSSRNESDEPARDKKRALDTPEENEAMSQPKRSNNGSG